jgi:hypothetical protein
MFDTNKFIAKYNIDSHIEEILFEEEIIKLEIEKLQNNIQDIDNREEKSIEYSSENYYIYTSDSENNFIISKNSTKKIEISKNEADLVRDSPKALKNLIDTNEKLDLL